jgi:hypothetical protein
VRLGNPGRHDLVVCRNQPAQSPDAAARRNPNPARVLEYYDRWLPNTMRRITD